MSPVLLRTLSASLLLFLLNLPGYAAPPKVASYQAMLDALDQNDSAKIETLQQGADVNAVDKRGVSLLMRAAIHSNTEVMKILLEHNADPNRKDREGNTALMWVFSWAEGDFIRGDPFPDAALTLLEGGAKIDLKNRAGMTPLMRAAGWHHPRSVKFLLEHGANLHLTDNLGRTALTWAAPDGKENESVRLLRERGAKVSVLEAVLMRDSAAAEDALNKGFGLKSRGPYGETALMAAAERGDADMVRALLEHGADPNGHDERGMTPLMLAFAGRVHHSLPGANPYLSGDPAEPGRYDIIRRLVESGAWINEPVKALASRHEFRDLFGATPLQLAIAVSPTSTVQFLMDHGADIGTAPSSRASPLLEAISPRLSISKFTSRPDIVRAILTKAEESHQKPGGWDKALLSAVEAPELLTLLLDQGAEVNQRDRYGRTALMYAARQDENRECVSLLLSKGADVRIRDREGCSALTFAANNLLWKKDQDLVPLLRAKGAPYQLIDAVLLNDRETVRSMLERGANPNVSNGVEETALMKAVLEGNVELVGLLLKHGAVPFARTTQGKVNLLAAAIEARNDDYVVKRLVAMRLTPPDWLETARMLIEAGAEINPSDHDRIAEENPLAKAISHDDVAMVRLLLQYQADPRIRIREWDKNVVVSALELAKSRGKAEIIHLLNQALSSRRRH